jgi:hypothetical protein
MADTACCSSSAEGPAGPRAHPKKQIIPLTMTTADAFMASPAITEMQKREDNIVSSTYITA